VICHYTTQGHQFEEGDLQDFNHRPVYIRSPGHNLRNLGLLQNPSSPILKLS
jgi:hypothetical protein